MSSLHEEGIIWPSLCAFSHGCLLTQSMTLNIYIHGLLAVQWLKVCFCCRGRGFKPWSETEFLHAVWQSQKTKHALDLKNLKKKKKMVLKN